MKSLDDLIRFLLEEIALCGNHGAGTSDFIKFVQAYNSTNTSVADGQASNDRPAAPVDRKLLEKTWQWLARYPEIHVGKDRKSNRLLLSEVEHLNASRSTAQREQPFDNAPPAPSQLQSSTAAEPPANGPNKEPVDAIAGDEAISRHPAAELRLYVSTERRWQALTGHAFDPDKIPRLDFACLSIIAAHREQGILQPDLVRISGQDKRSVPQRTQRLHDEGYISKTPVLVNRSHTSRLILKRYAPEAVERSNDARTASDAGTIFQPAQNSMDNPTDVHALHRAIFDLLRERKLITTVELKDKIGVTGLKWPMRVLARHLRRLERIGCLKQVRAHPDIETPSPYLFRCIRYIRDPEGQEWNPVIYPGKTSRLLSTSTVSNELDLPSDDEHDYQAEEAEYIARFGTSQQPESLKEAERPIPQWTGDSTLSNLLYDIVHSAGCQGISTMELKNRSMGWFTNRPVEHHISRLVEMWQISQPLHLRYLSIIRDSALTNGIPHYIHYSYENFKRLVDRGKASWELVMTITKEHKQLKDIAAINAQPDLDDNGFPKISNGLFQGPYNDASLADCNRGKDIKSPKLSSHDPVAVKPKGSEWSIQSGASQYRSRPQDQSTPATVQSEQRPDVRIKKPRVNVDSPNLVVSYNKGRGRGRKIPAEGFPPGFDQWPSAQKNKLLKSQFAARLYKMVKIVEEIKRRVESGTDRYEATATVLVLATKQYHDSGLEPPWDMMNKVKSDTLAPSLLALQGFDQKCSLTTTLTSGHDKTEAVKLKPSSAAHSRPLRDIEWQLVERILRSRIRTIQDVPIADSIPMAERPIPSNIGQQEQPNRRLSITSSKAKRDNVPSKAKLKPAQAKKTIMTPRAFSMQLAKLARDYLPSTVAHTQPLLLHETTSEVMRRSLKRKETPDDDGLARKPKRLHVKKLPFIYEAPVKPTPKTSPSHSLSLQSYEQQSQSISKPMPGLYIAREARLFIPGKRGRSRKTLLAVIKSPRIREMTFLPMQSSTTPQPLAPQDPARVDQQDHHVDGIHTAQPTQSYEQQLENISRPTSGFYLGQEVKLHQLGKRGRPCKSRLAVFKSPLISSIACFSARNLVMEEVLESNQPLLQYQAQNVGNSDAILQHAQNKGIPSAVSPTQQDLDAPELTPTSKLPSSTVQAGSNLSLWCMADANDDDGSTSKQTKITGAASDREPPQPLLTTPIGVQMFSDEICGSNGRSHSVPQGRESPCMEIIPNLLSITHDGTTGLAREFSERHENSVPGPRVSNTSTTSCPRDISSENSTELLGDSSSEDTASNRRRSALAVTSQDQSSNLKRTSPKDSLQPQIPAPQVSMTRSDARIPQPIQNDDHQNRTSDEILETSPQLTSISPNSPVAGNFAVAQPSKEPSTTFAKDLPFQNITRRSTKPKVRNGVKKVTLRGGTVAAQRQKIIMDIVEKCDGIYPGIPELCVPFKEEWNRAGYPGRPETPTLRAAVKTLCVNGRLRQLTFNFKDSRGVVIKKDMITKVEVSPTDPKVFEMQKSIIATYPSQYIPKETGLSDELRDVFWNAQGHAKTKTIKDLEVDESPVKLKRVPNYIENYEIKVKSREARRAEEERRMADLREMMAAGRLPQKAARSARRKIDRLESLNQKLLRKPEGHLPSTDEQAEADLHPAHMSLTRGTSPGRRSQTQFRALFREQTMKRLAELQRGRGHLQNNPSDFSHMSTIDDPEPDLTSRNLNPRLGQIESDFVSASIETPSPIRRPPGRPPKARGGQKFISWQTKAAGSYQMPDPNNTSQTFIFQLSGNTLMPRRNSHDSDWHSPEARQQMYTIMEPEHQFHPATGTFAVNFSRWRTVNQICHRYHWQRSCAKDFADHVDDLMIYELTANGSEHAMYSNWPFINYTFPHVHWTSPDQGPSTQASWFSKIGGLRGYERIDSEDSWTNTSADPWTLQRSVVSAKRKRNTSEGIGPCKTRRLTTVAKLSQLTKPRPAGDIPGRLEPMHKIPRKMKKRRERVLTADEVRRILIAVIVVRTLAGGIERHIDWVLVTKIFEPEHDQAYIQSKWPRVLQSHKLLAQQLQANFQDLFLRAYRDGLVPPLDYNDLLAYDWAWLVNWTIDHIDTPASGAPDLPLQRDRLDRMFQLSVGDDTNLHAYYEMDSVASIPRRETDLHKKAWVRSLTTPAEESSDLQAENLEILKTWIRANVATKARTYNPRLARDKLAQFDPELIDQALKEMLTGRILMAQNKGRLMPGRNYDLNEQYLKPLKKKIEAAKFLEAPIIKRGIDQTLAEKREMIIPELTDDVDMIVMQNMQAHGRIALVAKNPPMQKFGLTDNGSYRVRLMDKRKLHFQVGVRATDAYVMGNPLLPLPDPPSGPKNSMDDDDPRPTKIPLWYDIHGDLIPELWQLAVAATMSVLVTRPGIAARVLEPSVRPSLGLCEVQMILDWMVEARAARETDGLYVTEEWWWLCLDH
ncbi:MAG: hypothetical protein LQ349_002064, partial [Xanthoria aureola]